MSGDGYTIPPDTVIEYLPHQEQCAWCGERANCEDDPSIGMAVLNGLWRPAHEGECTDGVNNWLMYGEHKPPFYVALSGGPVGEADRG
jgi:hypothetical protein